MTGARRLAGAALASVLSLAACGRDAPKRAATVDSAPSLPPVALDATGKPTCPHTGRWSLCAVRERLDRSGLVPLAPADSVVRRPFFAVPGLVYALGQAQLEVYVYADSAAVLRDVAALDTTAVAPRGEAGKWPAKPTFIRSANMLAVLLTANERQIERVQLALTAGPPPADRPGMAQTR